MNNIRGIFENAVEKQPNKPYLWFEGEEFTFIEIYHEAAKAANGFKELGVKKGDRVALMLPNLPEFMYIWLGLNSIGVSIVPINTFLKEDETSYIVNHSDAIFVVTHQDYYSIFEKILPSCPKVNQCVVVDSDLNAIDRISYSQLVSNQSNNMPYVELNENDEASILYTSGTTGNPKGCIEPHSYYMVAGKRYAEHVGLTDKDCVITPLPLFHMNPQILSTMGTMLVGGRLALVDRFHPSSWWDSVRESKATHFHYLGVMPSMLIGQEARSDDKDHPHWIGIGAGVPYRLHQQFEERFNVTLLEVFGMTECGLNFCTHTNDDRKVGTGCFGKVFPEYEAKVVDDNDQEVETGEIGELILRGSKPGNRKLGFMREYYKNAEATEEAWKCGWFHTGDFVKADEEGNFYFVDRKKDIVRRSGENISASEVEDVIRTHPDILDVAVIPVPDPVREQEVKAYVIPHKDAKPNIDDLISWCEDKLAYFKIPRYWETRSSFPVTKTGKVQKQKLKTEVEDLRMNSYDRTDKVLR